MMTEKSILRKQVLSERNKFLNRNFADEEISKKLVYECRTFNKIFIYINYGSEVSTINFIKASLELDKEIYVPVCNTSDLTMKAVRIFSMDNLVKNDYGIFEPVDTNKTSVQFDSVIFPGAVFDLTGNRIGYGKGYYDKFMSCLNCNPVKIGICYDLQLKHLVPSEVHDVKMDIILTENRSIFL